MRSSSHFDLTTYYLANYSNNINITNARKRVISEKPISQHLFGIVWRFGGQRVLALGVVCREGGDD